MVKKKILIVDDEKPDVPTELRLHLAANEYDVISASDRSGEYRARKERVPI